MDEYATSFGFTEEEVFATLEECGLAEEKEQVKAWYDGFIFGEHKDIYNPWSILNFMDTGKRTTYWANTSSNSLVGKLLREGTISIKEKFEILLDGKTIKSPIDEQIVYNQLNGNERAIWSLLLASGYGRYDVMLEPKNPTENDAIILEFKIHEPEEETTLQDTVQETHRQIAEKQYAAQLIARGIPAEKIRCYGFAFEGKKVLIG